MSATPVFQLHRSCLAYVVTNIVFLALALLVRVDVPAEARVFLTLGALNACWAGVSMPGVPWGSRGPRVRARTLTRVGLVPDVRYPLAYRLDAVTVGKFGRSQGELGVLLASSGGLVFLGERGGRLAVRASEASVRLVRMSSAWRTVDLLQLEVSGTVHSFEIVHDLVDPPNVAAEKLARLLG